MKLITAEEAKELNQNFIKTRSKDLDKIVERETGKPKEKDAISSWFSLDELKEYIAYVEAEGKAKNIDIDGIRIYFGAYATNDKKQDKKALSTVFMVPTQPRVGSLQKDGIAVAAPSADVESIEGMNRGSMGYPPSAAYPQ
ncbi:hypothetical protein EC396_00080 [Lutibacter sp. HS1-25]|uniref:hypothetical protein n=1 Tax=Lutibacter sp. HS1-25 TaxID=2485000 RepID=UPI0010112881|nr:hypothetical protein [Lutibacter sp. HS1-25]RXP64412.1 hypothetical protein EC396_00080 [Lutibacter sp. HS1-25]